MADETTTDATGFGEISYDFAAASTPLSDLNGGEPAFSHDVGVDINEDEDDGSEDDDDDESEEEEDEEEVQVEERIVQDDGTVVIKIKSSGEIKKKKKKKSKKSKKSRKNKEGAAAVAGKITAFAVSAMATAAASSGTAHAPGAIQTGAWSAGLFNCFDFCTPNCCMVTFCPCVSAAQIATRIGFKYTSVLLAFGVAVAIDLLMYILMLATIDNGETYSYYSFGYYYTYTYSDTRLTAWGYIAMAVSLLVFLAFWQLRTKVREKFQLPGSPLEDLCVSCFCSCCALAQMATHVKSYKPGSCDFGPPDELPAYSAE